MLSNLECSLHFSETLFVWCTNVYLLIFENILTDIEDKNTNIPLELGNR